MKQKPHVVWRHARLLEPHQAKPDPKRAYIQPGTKRVETACLSCGEVVIRV